MIPTKEEIQEKRERFQEMVRENSTPAGWLREVVRDSGREVIDAVEMYFSLPQETPQEIIQEASELTCLLLDSVLKELFILGYMAKEEGWAVSE